MIKIINKAKLKDEFRQYVIKEKGGYVDEEAVIDYWISQIEKHIEETEDIIIRDVSQLRLDYELDSITQFDFIRLLEETIKNETSN